MFIKKHLNFKSLPETVTQSIAIFERRTEVVYEGPRVIDIQLLWSWAADCTRTKSRAEIPSRLMAAVAMLPFPMGLEFHPSLYILCRLHWSSQIESVCEPSLQAVVRSRGR